MPNQVTPSTQFNLHTQDYRFKKGHRIMVQVQSTWFPLIDRNPQTFVPNIFEAKEADYQRRDDQDPSVGDVVPSGVVLPIVTSASP